MTLLLGYWQESDRLACGAPDIIVNIDHVGKLNDYLFLQRADCPLQILNEVSNHKSDFPIRELALQRAVVGKLPLKLQFFVPRLHWRLRLEKR
jgi:hypothetical protein